MQFDSNHHESRAQSTLGSSSGPPSRRLPKAVEALAYAVLALASVIQEKGESSG